MSKEFYPLTHSQRSILIIEQFFPGTRYNNISATVHIKQPIEYGFIHKAVNLLIQGNDALRTRIKAVPDQIVQYFAEYKQQEVDFYDFSYRQGRQDYSQWVEEMNSRPFSFYESDLYTFAVIKFADDEFGLYIKCHHIIGDFWSFVLLVNQFLRNYNDLKAGTETAGSYFSYTDYIAKEQSYLQTARFHSDQDYWDGQIAKLKDTGLFGARPGSSIEADQIRYELSGDITAMIGTMGSTFGVSPFITFVSAAAIYFWKKLGRETIAVGTTLVNRSSIKDKKTFGAFFNNLPFIIDINPDLTFEEFVRDLHVQWLELLRHSSYPYVSLLKRYRETHKVKNDLFDFSLAFLNAHIQNDVIPIAFEGHFNHQEVNALRLNINDMETKGVYQFGYDYSVDVLTAQDIEEIHNAMLAILQQAVANPQKKIHQLSILATKEEQRVLYDFNKTDLHYNPGQTIVDLFQNQVRQNQAAIAVIDEDKHYTYEAINRKSNQLARLLKNAGVGRDDIVGLCVERSADLIIAMMAILKAQAAYLPIDPDYPEERIEYMLADSNCRLLIINSDQPPPASSNVKIIDLREPANWTESPEDFNHDCRPGDLANVIYTSGSTGAPKGVMIEHHSLHHLVQAMADRIELDFKNALCLTTLSFDIFFVEALWPVLMGKKVIIANNHRQLNPDLLAPLISEHRIDFIQATPSRMRSILKHCAACLNQVSVIILGGEPVPQTLLAAVKEVTPARVYNGYGPTETTVYSSIKLLDPRKEITIGSPLGRTQFYILDQYHRPVPLGTAGEIYIAGEGVARGYLNRPDLTNERFIRNPFLDGSRMYKTGDVAKWNDNGEIVYIGRNDDQVKLRGYRIEPGEIENQLVRHTAVDQAVVTSFSGSSSDRNYLYAYLQGKQRVSVQELREYLAKTLPEYMIPHKFIWLPEFPTTPNGKIDRKRLPAPSRGNEEKQQTVYIAARTETERKLAAIWQRVLEVDDIGINDDFFVLGGDSLAILEILSATLSYEWKLTAQEFYEYPTISGLAQIIEDRVDLGHGPARTDLSQSQASPLAVMDYATEGCDSGGNVLLTGATGFLGMHILRELLKYADRKIYCLIRPSHDGQKFRRLFTFYCPEFNAADIDDRIILVNGDVSQKELGLTRAEYDEIGQNVRHVIHSAAMVKHFGLYSDFKDVNVAGTQEMIDFCLKHGACLGFISTTSVSGNYRGEQAESRVFSEHDLADRHHYHLNVYVRSKAEAENLIVKAAASGLNATIYRVGVLTGRYADGQFQYNIEENAFYRRLRSIFEIGYLPETVLSDTMEFTPVDRCAQAIVALMHAPRKRLIYHVFNHREIEISNLLPVLGQNDIIVKVVSGTEFSKRMALLFQTEKGRDITSGIVHDLIMYGSLNFKAAVKVDSSLTVSALGALGFEWPALTEDYITKIIRYMQAAQFLKREPKTI